MHKVSLAFMQLDGLERMDFPQLPDMAEGWQQNSLMEEQPGSLLPIQPLRFDKTIQEIELDQRSRLAGAAFRRQPLYSRIDSAASDLSTTAKVSLLFLPCW